MPVKVEITFSAKCDECGQYAGSYDSEEKLEDHMTKNGWYKDGERVLCGRHNSFPSGTRVYALAGVNPIGQNKTWQGFLALEGGGGNHIWNCGHKHRSKHGDPIDAFACAKAHALEQGWVDVATTSE